MDWWSFAFVGSGFLNIGLAILLWRSRQEVESCEIIMWHVLQELEASGMDEVIIGEDVGKPDDEPVH